MTRYALTGFKITAEMSVITMTNQLHLARSKSVVDRLQIYQLTRSI